MSEDRSIPISPAALEAFAAGAAFMPQNTPARSADNEAHPAEEEAATEPSDAGRPEAASATEQSSEPSIEEAIDSSDTVSGKAAEEPTAPPTDLRFPISVLPGFCTRLAGSTCKRCTFVCPYDAISFDEDDHPHIDEEFCTRCGLCCGICDAFVTERITMNDLLDKVRRLSGEGEPVFFTCYDQIPEDFEVHPNVVVLPCIGAVAPEFWLAALEANPELQIYCNFSLCTDCPTAGPEAKMLLTHAVNLGERWSRIHMGKAEHLPEKTDILSRFFEATSDEFHRRGVATSLAHEAADIASGKHRKRYNDTLAKFHEQKARLRAQGHAQNAHHHQHVPSTPDLVVRKPWPRLTLAARTVEEHPEIAPNIPRYFATVDGALCERCYELCFSHCPAGARSLDEFGAIKVDPKLCIACGNCALYCPTGAAYLYETDGTIFLSEQNTDE